MVCVPLYSTTDNYGGFRTIVPTILVWCVPLYSTSDHYGGFHTILNTMSVWCVSHCIQHQMIMVDFLHHMGMVHIPHPRSLCCISHWIIYHIQYHVSMVCFPLYAMLGHCGGFHTIFYTMSVWCVPPHYIQHSDHYGGFHTIFHAILVWCVSHCILHQGTMVEFTPYSTSDHYHDGRFHTIFYTMSVWCVSHCI